MSQTVTKESLNALAMLAFQGVRFKGTRFDPMYNMHSVASSALYELMGEVYEFDLKDEEQWTHANGFIQGMEFGLAVAASIISNGLDSVATKKQVKAELDACVKLWREACRQPGAA